MKAGVQAAANRIASALHAKGALPRIVPLPNLIPNGKTGGDDFLHLLGAAGALIFTKVRDAAPLWVPAVVEQKASYPAPMSKAALHGPVGEFVNLVLPQTEADPAALTVIALAALGCLIGRTPFYQVEATQHHARLFTVIVGDTSSARKGTATDRAMKLIEAIDSEFLDRRKLSGLSTGEGLISAVKDAVIERIEVKAPEGMKKLKGSKKAPPVIAYEDKIINPGELDKRLLIVEPEFAGVLHHAGREGNILSTVIRDAWDGKPLRVLARSNKDSCKEPHAVIVGNITCEEAQRLLTNTDRANGFANRFLWTCAKRSKCLPHGGDDIDTRKWNKLVARFRAFVEFSKTAGRVNWDAAARKKWEQVYPVLSSGSAGMYGALTARAEAQVVRLSTLYALLDCSKVIRIEHLNAALEVWRYCADSVAYIFGNATGDETADEIVRMLKAAPDGMTQTAISSAFGRNKSAAELQRALGVLQQRSMVAVEQQQKTKGAPTTVWKAAQ